MPNRQHFKRGAWCLSKFA